MNTPGVQLYKYTDRTTVALMKSYKFWLYHMSRKDRGAWNVRGLQILAKIEKAYGVTLNDKKNLSKEVRWEIDRQHARSIVYQYQGRTGFSDDESS